MSSHVLKQFPTLYETDSKGNLKEWTVSAVVEGNVHFILTRYGRKGGKLISNKRIVKEGKNFGKANETSVSEQTIKEAESKFNKKKKMGHFEKVLSINEPKQPWTEFRDQENPSSKEKQESVSLPFKFFPMLALDYNKRGKSIQFPCFTQPKLDGVRGCMIEIQGKTRLFSRTFNEYFVFDHITKSVNIPDGIVLDGELYTQEVPFEDITGIARRSSVSKLNATQLEKLEKIKFYVFDIYDSNKPELSFIDRYNRLIKMVNLFGSNIVIVPCKKLENPYGLKEVNAEYISDGYEGTMLRNEHGSYKLKNRSKDLQKYKLFEDSEFKIIGFEEAQGSEIVFVLEYSVKDSSELGSFKCKPKGTKEYKRELLDLAKSDFNKHFSGKMYTVRYQELSQKGCPRFPVGISLRDYE